MPVARRHRWVLLLVPVFLLAGFAVAHGAAAEELGAISKITIQIVGAIVQVFVSFLGQILIKVIDMIVSVAQYNSFGSADVVEIGWVVMRDLSNMFFIVILLVIAFGTVLKWESYRYNRLLGRLILMAVLINFSKFIALFFIDVSQVIMLTFVHAFANAAAGNLTTGFGVEKMLELVKTGQGEVTLLSAILALILAVVLLIIAVVVSLIILLMLVQRIIAFWLLVVFSPVAYLAAALPPGKLRQFHSTWWEQFGKYWTTGPLLAFFLWLAMTVIQRTSGQIVTLDTAGQTLSGNIGVGESVGANAGLAFAASQISTTQNLFNYIVTIGILMAAIAAAQRLGGVAGGFAGQAMGKIQQVGTRVARRAAVIGGVAGGAVALPGVAAGVAAGVGGIQLARTAGRRIRRGVRDTVTRFAPGLNIPALIRGARERGKELEETSAGRAGARGREVYEALKIPLVKHAAAPVPHLALYEARRVRDFISEISRLNKEQKASLLTDRWGKGGTESELLRRALMEGGAAEGHLDDFLETEFFRKKAKWYDSEGNERTGFQKEDGTYYSHEIARNFLQAAVTTGKERRIGDKYMTEGAYRTLHDIGEVHGKKTGHFEYFGTEKFDPEAKKGEQWKIITTNDAARANAQGEMNKLGLRASMGLHPHNFGQKVWVEDEQGGRPTWVFGGPEGSTERTNLERIFEKKEEDEIRRYGPVRHVDLLGKVLTDQEYEYDDPATGARMKKRGVIIKVEDNPKVLENLQKVIEMMPELVNTLVGKSNADAIMYKDRVYPNIVEVEKGKPVVKHHGLVDLGSQLNWNVEPLAGMVQQPIVPPAPNYDRRSLDVDQMRAAADAEHGRIWQGRPATERDLVQDVAQKQVRAERLQSEIDKEERFIREEELSLSSVPIIGRGETERRQQLEKRKAQLEERRKEYGAISQDVATKVSRVNPADLKQQVEIEKQRAKADQLATKLHLDQLDDFGGQLAAAERDALAGVSKSELGSALTGISQSLEEFSKRGVGLPAEEFAVAFEKSIQTVEKSLGDLPKDLKKTLDDRIQNLRTDIVAGRMASFEDQGRSYFVLQKILKAIQEPKRRPFEGSSPPRSQGSSRPQPRAGPEPEEEESPPSSDD